MKISYASPAASARKEEKHKPLTAKRKKRDIESIAIGGMLFEFTGLEAPPIEFDEKLR